MARIRTIKPEFWQHPKTGLVSRDARLLFLGLLNEADDEGRMRYSAKRLAGVLFPFDEDVTPDLLTRWVTELERAEYITRYTVEDALYLEIPGFCEHQRISHAKDSILPKNVRGSRAEAARNDRGSDAEAARGEQGTGNREQGTGNREVIVSLVATPDSVSLVFDAWKVSTDKSAQTVLNPKRRRLIVQALKDYPLEDVLSAVRGWENSQFHSGQNEQRKVYNDLELLLRDSQHIEQFRDLERGTNPIGRAPDPATDLVARMREMEGR